MFYRSNFETRLFIFFLLRQSKNKWTIALQINQNNGAKYGLVYFNHTIYFSDKPETGEESNCSSQ